MRIPFVFVLLFAFFSSFSQNESHYKINLKLDIPLTTVGLSNIIAAHYLESNGLTLVELDTLDRNKLWKLDRKVTNYHSPNALKISDIGQGVVFALPLTLLALKPVRKNILPHLLMMQEVFILTTGITYMAKVLVKRPRPYAYNSASNIEERSNPKARNSFPSGRTSFTSAYSFFTASLIQEYSENKTVKTVAWVGAFTLPAAMAYLRVTSGQHFYTDVLAGYVLGGAIGWLIPEIHKKKNENIELYPYLMPNGNGVCFSLKF